MGDRLQAGKPSWKYLVIKCELVTVVSVDEPPPLRVGPVV